MSLLIHGGTVITMDARRTVILDGAVAIAGDRIAGVGPARDLRARFPDYPVQDATDKLILPGFLNLHTHSALVIVRGVCEDRASIPAYTPGVPQGVLMSPDDCYALSQLGALEVLRHGATLVSDNYIHSRANVRAFAELGIRALVSERVHDADLSALREGEYRFDPAIGERTLALNVELIEAWNGKADGRIRALLGPHAPDTCSPRLLRQIGALAEQLKVGMTIHLAQSRAEVEVVRTREGKGPAAYLAECGVLRPRTLAGHAIHLDEAELRLLNQSGASVSHHPVGNAKYGEMAPAWRLRGLGTVVGLATDAMTSDMVEVMRFALCVARIRGDGLPPPKAADVLAMATIDGARAVGLDGELGSLEPGKKADLLIMAFRRPHHIPTIDPVATLVHSALGSDVETVLVDGRIVVDGGRATLIDEEEVIVRAEKVARRLWEAARR